MENKYLEKIAGPLGILRNGFSGLGSKFQGVDAAVGSVQRTVAKAFKPTTTFNTAAAGRSEIRGQLRSVNNKNMSDDQIRKALSGMAKGNKIQFGGKTLNNRYIKQMSGADLRRAHTRANITHLRQNAGLMREAGTGGMSTQAGKITGVNRGNYIGTPKPDFNASKLLPNTNRQSSLVDAGNKRINAARFKVGLGATGLAGAGALGYHMANRGNQAGYTDQQFYMP